MEQINNKLVVIQLNELYQLMEEVFTKCMSAQKNDDIPNIFGIETLCLLTGYSKSSIYKMTARNEIPCHRYGRKLLFQKDEIMAHLTANRNETISEYCERKQKELPKSRKAYNNK